ncbi:MAG: DUF3106 domain-containing protein [Acidobacteriota bacterium]|nr:DUF3106 domain-containing protein [Acidobacteriota bacterium]
MAFASPLWAREPQPGAAKGANHPPARAGAKPATKATPPQEHLQQWMERHRELPLTEQQRALEHEPGFHELPSETQQHMRDRLAQLNTMTPQQRDRILERNEALERMSAPERQQYRSAVQSFATMSPDRRRLVARAVLDLRAMPPDQRQSVMTSDRFRGQFSDAERATLGSLLSAEPYIGSQSSQ